MPVYACRMIGAITLALGRCPARAYRHQRIMACAAQLIPSQFGTRILPCVHLFESLRPSRLGLFVAVAATGLAQRGGTPATSPGTPSDATARIVAAAQAVLTTLDEAGRAKVQFPFDGPQKTKWSNLPSPMFQREGIRLADLTAAQRAAVDTLLSTALSRDGYRKVTEIMRGDGVLRRAAEGRAGAAGGRGGARGAAAVPGSPRTSTSSPSWERRR